MDDPRELERWRSVVEQRVRRFVAIGIANEVRAVMPTGMLAAIRYRLSLSVSPLALIKRPAGSHAD